MRPPPRPFTVHRHDARRAATVLNKVDHGKPCLTATITSPPYADLIDYGYGPQIGRGQTYAEYLADCRKVFATVHDYTLQDGSLWVIADTVYDKSVTPSAVRPIPFDLAAAAADAGWVLRETVIWDKDKTRPWSGRGRMRNAFEYVLFFVKSNDYKFRVDRLRDPIELGEWWVQYPERYNPQGKAPTNLWRIPIPVQGTWTNTTVQHACPLPPDLVERIVYLSTDEGDVVFDPFAGSGTVVAEAERLGRKGLGTELNPAYVRAYNSLVRPEIMARRGEDELTARLEASERLRDVILALRAVKYPKTLYKQYLKAFPDAARPTCAVALLGHLEPEVLLAPHQLIDVTTLFVCDIGDDDREELQRRMKELTQRKPLTGFGIAGDVRVVAPADLAELTLGHDLHLYEHGRTWTAVRQVAPAELVHEPASGKRGAYPPIASNVRVNETPRRIYA